MNFKVGDTIERIVESRGANVGYKYKVIEYDFWSNEKLVLVADGGYIKELLSADRAKEYKKIEG
jgi:hypothetical protein